MGDLIWVFKSVVHGGLIARREPHYYQYILDPATGEDIMILSSGASIVCPAWESVRITDGRQYGMAEGRTYDITDLVLAATGAATSTATATSG
jgi:hypothetical protein